MPTLEAATYVAALSDLSVEVADLPGMLVDETCGKKVVLD